MKEVSKSEAGEGRRDYNRHSGPLARAPGPALLQSRKDKGCGRGTRMRGRMRPGRASGATKPGVTTEKKPLYPTATWSRQRAGFVGAAEGEVPLPQPAPTNRTLILTSPGPTCLVSWTVLDEASVPDSSSVALSVLPRFSLSPQLTSSFLPFSLYHLSTFCILQYLLYPWISPLFKISSGSPDPSNIMIPFASPIF